MILLSLVSVFVSWIGLFHPHVMINLLQCCVTQKCQIALDYYDGSPNITPHRLRTASVEAGPKRAFTEGQCPVQAPPQPLNENLATALGA